MKEHTKAETSDAHGREPAFMDLLSGWMQQGVGSFFATQRILLDLVMRQNANALSVVRERLMGDRFSAATVLTEVAGGGMSNFIEAQKVLLHMAQRQNEIVMTGVKERMGEPAAMMTDVLRRSVETFIEMQQKYLDIASKQTKAWMQAAKEGKIHTDGLSEVAQEAMDAFVHAQKKFLDVVEQETVKATHKTGTAKKEKATELGELAQEATDAFVDAQKKLLDVASRQVQVSVKAAGQTAEMLKPTTLLPWAELTREGVKSFVDAEKALLDVMTKTATTHHEPEKQAHHGPRPIPRKKTTKARTAKAGA